MLLPAGLVASLAERLQKAAALLVIGETGLAVVTTIHDVVHCPRILDTQLASHGRSVQKTNLPVKPDMTISLTDSLPLP